jgi:hypothetical protein
VLGFRLRLANSGITAGSFSFSVFPDANCGEESGRSADIGRPRFGDMGDDAARVEELGPGECFARTAFSRRPVSVLNPSFDDRLLLKLLDPRGGWPVTGLRGGVGKLATAFDKGKDFPVDRAIPPPLFDELLNGQFILDSVLLAMSGEVLGLDIKYS